MLRDRRRGPHARRALPRLLLHHQPLHSHPRGSEQESTQVRRLEGLSGVTGRKSLACTDVLACAVAIKRAFGARPQRALWGIGSSAHPHLKGACSLLVLLFKNQFSGGVWAAVCIYLRLRPSFLFYPPSPSSLLSLPSFPRTASRRLTSSFFGEFP